MGEVVWTDLAPAQFEIITPFTTAEDGQFTNLDNFAIQITSEKLDGVVVEGQPHELIEFLHRVETALLDAWQGARANKERGHRD